MKMFFFLSNEKNLSEHIECFKIFFSSYRRMKFAQSYFLTRLRNDYLAYIQEDQDEPKIYQKKS